MTDFRQLRTAADDFRARQSTQRLKEPTFRQRLDLLFGALLSVRVLIWLAAGGLLAIYVDRSGVMDPAVLRVAPDDRKLTNVRDFISPLVDAAIPGDGTEAILARADGVVHVVDIDKELFREESLPISEAFSGRTRTVSASCTAGALECEAGAATLLSTALGGVAMRENDGRWRVLLGDQAWVGASGDPVEQSAVTQWAVSGNGATLLVLAGTEGSAFFDQTSALWRPITTDPSLGQRGLVEKFAVHAIGRFWVATDQGLFSISENDSEPAFFPHPDLRGDILDLDLSHDGRLRVLERGPCRRGGVAGCLTLSEVTGADRARRIIGEDALYPQLSAASVNHAALQSGRLVVLGQAGAYTYDPTRRGWTQIHAAAIDTLHAVDDGERIVFASGEDVGEITSGAVSNSWTLESAPARQVIAARDGSVYALARDGNLYDVGRGRQLTFKDARVPDTAEFTTGATVGRITLLIGPQGVWVHDVDRRRNTWLPAGQAPPDLTRPGPAQLFVHGNSFVLVRKLEAEVSAISVSGSADAATVSTKPVDTGLAQGPFLQAALGTDGLRIVDARGWPFQYTAGAPSRLLPLVGEATIRSETAPRFVSAAGHRDGILFADPTGIWPYSISQRAWQRPLAPPASEAIRDISVGDGLFALMASGRVYRAGESGWDSVLGAGLPLPLSRRDVSDAMAEGGLLFLGGSGQVAAYDVGRGIIAETWGGGAGPVRLLRIEGRVPVWVSGGQLFRGNRALVSDGLVNAWEAPDGITALMRNPRNGRLFLQNFAKTSGRFSCVFAGDAAPRGNVIATRRIDADRVLVATDQGAALHNSRYRRWVTVTGLPQDPDLRLDIAEGFLVAHRPSQFLAIPISDLPRPGSCETGPVAVPWDDTFADLTVEFDAASGTAVLLTRDGAVWEWRRGLSRRLYDAPTVGPAPSELVRLRQLGNGDPLFVGRDAVWRYSVAARRWASTPIDAPEGSTMSITALEGDVATITVWDGPARTLFGTWTPDSQQVTLSEFPPVRAPRINTPPDAIVDMAENENFIAVVSASGIEIGRRNGPTLDGRVPFGSDAPDLRLYDYGRHPALIDGPADRPDTLWLLPEPETLAETRSSLSDLAYIYLPATDREFTISRVDNTIWRIDATGALLRCDIVPGAVSPDRCETQSPAPFAYAPDRLIESYRIGGTWALFFSDRTVRISATTWRDPEVVEGFVLQSGDEVVRDGSLIYIRRNATREVFRLGDEGRTERVGSDIRSMQRAGSGFAIGTSEGVRLLPSGPSGEIQPLSDDLSGVSLDSSRRFVGVSTDGSAVLVDSGRVLSGDLTLPTNARFVQIGRFTTWNGRAFDGWWVQVGDTLNFHYIFSTDISFDLPPLPLLGDFDPVSFDVEVQFRAFEPDLVLPIESTLRRISGPPDNPLFATDDARFSLAGISGFTSPTPSSDPWGGLQTAEDVRSQVIDRSAAYRGRLELEPPRFETQGTGIATAVYDGRQSRRIDGTTSPRPWNAMQLPWIGWNRTNGVFDIATNTGTQSLAASDAIKDGRFLPTHPGVGAVAADGSIAHLNRYGLWGYRHSGASPAAIRIGSFAAPIAATETHFYLSSTDGVEVASGNPATMPDTASIVLGDLTLTERIATGGVRADHIRRGAPSAQAWGQSGFRFDQRSGVGWLAGQPVVMTPDGFAPLRSLSGFSGGPPAPATRVLTQGQASYAAASDEWYEGTADGSWSGVGNPTIVRRLDAPSGMQWSQELSGTRIAADAAWRVARDGLDFHADQLRAAASDGSEIIYVSDLGTHSSANQAGIAMYSSALASAPPSLTLDALPVTPGNKLIFAGSGSSAQVWDPAARLWSAPQGGQEPYLDRLAVDDLGLRVRFLAGRPAEFRRELTRPDRSKHFFPFDWNAGQYFPFDRANAFWAEGDGLLIATDFGLRQIPGTALTGGNDALYDMSQTASPDVRHLEVGRPFENGSAIIAKTGQGDCGAFASLTAPPVACTGTPSLERRYVAATPLWEWWKTTDGAFGAYVTRTGGRFEVPSGPVSGHWPHDRLRASVECGGANYELWSSGDVLLEGSLSEPAISQEQVRPESLHCQLEPLHVSGAFRLTDGLFGRMSGGFQLRQDATWQDVDPLAHGLLSRSEDRTIAFDSRRLRIIADGRSDSYLHRWNDDVWRPLSWRDGLPGIDATEGFVEQGDTIVRATPEGLVTTPVSVIGRMDPDRLTLRTGTLPTSFQSCRIDQMATRDGRTQAVPQLPGDPIAIRCADGTSLKTSEAPGADIGGVVTSLEDPFVEKTLIEDPDTWTWRLEGAGPGQSGSLRATFKSEPLDLSGGRFAIDDYRSIAAPFADSEEIVSANGWWRHPAGAFGLLSGTRPRGTRIEADATGVFADRQEDAPRLCVQTGSTATAFTTTMDATRQSECRDWLGQDAVWEYRRSASGIADAETVALNGPILNRSVAAGRFTDRVATGAPVFGVTADEVYVPTPLGVGQFQASGQATGHYAFSDPSGLMHLPGGELAALSRQGLVGLGSGAVPEACAGLHAAGLGLPPEALLEKVERVGDQDYRIVFSLGDRRHMPVVRCDDTSSAGLPGGGPWISRAMVEDRRRHTSVMRPLAHSTAVLDVSVSGGVVAVSDGARRAAILEPGVDGTLRALLNDDEARAVLIVTDQEVYLVDKDAAISTLASSEAGAAQ